MVVFWLYRYNIANFSKGIAMIEKGTNISEEEVGLESQSGDYLPDEEKYDRYAEMGDYYAERATKEAQSLPYEL